MVSKLFALKGFLDVFQRLAVEHSLGFHQVVHLIKLTQFFKFILLWNLVWHGQSRNKYVSIRHICLILNEISQLLAASSRTLRIFKSNINLCRRIYLWLRDLRHKILSINIPIALVIIICIRYSNNLSGIILNFRVIENVILILVDLLRHDCLLILCRIRLCKSYPGFVQHHARWSWQVVSLHLVRLIISLNFHFFGVCNRFVVIVMVYWWVYVRLAAFLKVRLVLVLYVRIIIQGALVYRVRLAEKVNVLLVVARRRSSFVISSQTTRCVRVMALVLGILKTSITVVKNVLSLIVNNLEYGFYHVLRHTTIIIHLLDQVVIIESLSVQISLGRVEALGIGIKWAL